eukprot:799247-Rhodomonas_salina.1
MFRFSVPQNSIAWELVSRNAGRCSKQSLTEIFLISPLQLTNVPFLVHITPAGFHAHLVKYSHAFQVAMQKHGTVNAMFNARRKLVSQRNRNQKPHFKVYWQRPFHELTQSEKNLRAAERETERQRQLQ